MDVTDVAELAELLEFLGGWLEFHADRRLDRSLLLFSGYGRDTEDLRADLARFAALLDAEEERLAGGPA
jgi:hypothetical protein